MVGEGDVGGPGGAVPSGRIAVWSTISHVELVGRGDREAGQWDVCSLT